MKINEPHVDSDDLWVILWSVKQKCFHYEKLSETIKYGVEAYAEENEDQTYLVLFVAKTRDELDYFQAKLIEERGDKRP